MLAALLFVLARNLVKLFVERRKALPFARFRAKLVLLLMGMTFVPSVLLLVVGSELITTSIDRWFNAPIEEVLASANRIAGDYYRERQRLVSDHAAHIAGTLSATDVEPADAAPLRKRLLQEVTPQRVQRVAVYRVRHEAAGGPALDRLTDVTAAGAPVPEALSGRAASDRLAAQALAGSADPQSVGTLGGGGDLLHAAAIVRSADGRAAGVVVATDYLPGDVVRQSRSMTQAFQNYNQIRVLKRPLEGTYLSFFLMVTLLILVGATWMGLYMAKRITRPVQMLAAAAREIGQGHFNQRVEPQSNDEFGSLVDAFNAMAGELAA